jgi:hypothetical protein
MQCEWNQIALCTNYEAFNSNWLAFRPVRIKCSSTELKTEARFRKLLYMPLENSGEHRTSLEQVLKGSEQSHLN